MIEEIKQLAKGRYDKRDYEYHILPVVKYALILGKKLKADLEVIEVAAYLHDIGRAVERKKYKKENIHHIEGMQEGRRILQSLGYDENFIKKVEHCILTHRGRKGPYPESLEAKIIACADAMSHFDTFLDLFYFFLENNEFEEAVIGCKIKMERNWNKKLILPEAREIIKEKYEAVMLILNSMIEFMEKD